MRFRILLIAALIVLAVPISTFEKTLPLTSGPVTASLSTVPRTVTQTNLASITITISNFSFSPKVQAVQKGAAITWVNNDVVSYTLWFTNSTDSSTIAFSPPIPPGGNWSTSFPKPWNIRYYDFDRLWITGSLAVAFPINLFRFDFIDYNNDNNVDIVDASPAVVCFDATNTSANWPFCKYYDFYHENEVTVLDMAILAVFFDQTTNLSPFPGQGQPTFKMDPSWNGACSLLAQPDKNYCNALP